MSLPKWPHPPKPWADPKPEPTSVNVDEMLHRTRTWCGRIRLVEWNDGTVFTLAELRRAHHYHAVGCEGCGKDCADRE